MKQYISIDIETTSLDPKTGQIIEFAAIIEDLEKKLPFEECPKFQAILEYPLYKGEAYPLHMHNEMFKKLGENQKKSNKEKEELGIIPAHELGERFLLFLQMNGYKLTDTINVAGKNFGMFDMRFLREHNCDFGRVFTDIVKISHRILDPAILFFDPKIDDRLPNLEECKKRAGLTDTTIAHTALEDAWDVIQVMRYKLNK